MSNGFSVRRLARKVWAIIGPSGSAPFGPLFRPDKQRIEAVRQIVEASLLFDGNWYLQRYPDVAKAGSDPLDHYLTLGWREGRDPAPMFNTSAYLKANEDVAKSGVNPLLHFVQFGLAEGREGFGDRHLPRIANAEPPVFADAHDCVSFPQPAREPVIWCRGYRLDRGHPRFVAVGESGAGYARNSACQAAVHAAVRSLRLFSGCPEDHLPLQRSSAAASTQWLLDAWYVNSAQLRTRWDGDRLPTVLRAFQCDPVADGPLRLVGEGVITSSLGFMDVHLLNPYFPILFVAATPDGGIEGTEILTFPSLCRGGTHYPELLWASAQAKQSSLNVTGTSRDLEQALFALLGGEAQAAVAQISVGGANADGNGPLFRMDLRQWLDRVLQIGIVASERAKPGGSAPGLARSSTSKARIRRNGGGTLVVAAAAAPTIASLIAPRTGSEWRENSRPLPLLAARIDPSKPVILIDVPARAGAALQSIGSELPWLMPNADGLVPIDFPAAAIRAVSGQELSDAQLLVPRSGSADSSAQSRSAITWLIHPDEWAEEQLVQAIVTAGLQPFATHDAIAFVGLSTSGPLALAGRQFPGQVTTFRSREEAVRHLTTPLAGYIAGGVLLHDPRIADCFSSMLSNGLVSTASCVIVSAEKRAGVVKTAIVDGGALVNADGRPAGLPERADGAVELWQSDYPVLRPSAHLWATRSELLTLWSNEPSGEPSAPVIHLCSSVVTATYVKKGAAVPHIPNVPEALETATKVAWLVG